MLRGNDTWTLIQLFPIVPLETERAHRLARCSQIAKVNGIKFELVECLRRDWSHAASWQRNVSFSERKISKLAKLSNKVFTETWQTEVHMVRFYLTDHMTGYIVWFNILEYLKGSKIERFNVAVKRKQRWALKWYTARMKETLLAMKRRPLTEWSPSYVAVKERPLRNVKDDSHLNENGPDHIWTCSSVRISMLPQVLHSGREEELGK